jgi:hypothetical protein
MQGSLLRSRAPVAASAAAPLARGNAASTSGAAARRSAPVARAAMVEELEAMSTDAAFDKDDAYRRFEALLGEADIAFATGDKVRRARDQAALGTGTRPVGRPPHMRAPAARRPAHLMPPLRARRPTAPLLSLPPPR